MRKLTVWAIFTITAFVESLAGGALAGQEFNVGYVIIASAYSAVVLYWVHVGLVKP